MKTLSILTLTLILFTACQSEPTPKKNNAEVSPTPSHETSNIQDIKTEEVSDLVIHNKNIKLPDDSRQLMMVTTSDWNSKIGTLQRYERLDMQSKAWKTIGEPINIILGRNGLGWGKGLHTTPNDAKYVKKEGDGRAPAGLFTLGNGFGYNNFSINFPYATYKRTDHCVDDSHSQWYNKIIDSTKIKKDYKSYEHMKLKNEQYKYGITVNHNPEQIANAGSCIFMHIRSGNGKGTAGCTAMDEGKILEILKWLQEEKKPLLLQLPAKEV